MELLRNRIVLTVGMMVMEKDEVLRDRRGLE